MAGRKLRSQKINRSGPERAGRQEKRENPKITGVRKETGTGPRSSARKDCGCSALLNGRSQDKLGIREPERIKPTKGRTWRRLTTLPSEPYFLSGNLLHSGEEYAAQAAQRVLAVRQCKRPENASTVLKEKSLKKVQPLLSHLSWKYCDISKKKGEEKKIKCDVAWW